MKRVMLLLSLHCVTAYVMGQFSISGKVTSTEGDPLIGATVIIEETFKGSITDAYGQYELSNLSKGEYAVTYSYIGFTPKTLTVEVSDKVLKNISLERKPYLADEVTVISTRASAGSPVAHTNLNDEEFEERNLGPDVPYLLNLTPSFVASSDAGTGIGYTNFRIRGTNQNRINVTVNGIPLNDAESHGVWWVNMPSIATSVKNIQVQRGVGTSTHGAAAFGGTINLQTTTLSDEPYAEIRSSAGSFNTFNNNVTVKTGLLNDQFSFDIRLSKITSDGYIDRASADMKSFYTSGAWYTDKSILRLNIFSGKEVTYQAWNGVPGARLADDVADMLRYAAHSGFTEEQTEHLLTTENPRTYNFYTYENEVDNYQQDHYQFIYTLEPLRNLSINSALHLTRGRGFYEQFKENDGFDDYLLDPIFVGSDSLITNNMNVDPALVDEGYITGTDLIRRKWLDNYFYGATLSAIYKMPRTEITVGGGWNQYDGDHFGRIIWAEYASNSEKGYEWYNGNGLKTDVNVYSRLQYKPVNTLQIFADLQYRQIDYEITGIDDDLRDISQNHLFSFFNPKVGATYLINPSQSVHFLYGRANREPTRSNYTDADPERGYPKPETLNDYEFGYKWQSMMAALEVNLYYMDYEDQLVQTGEINDVGSPIMTNVESSYRRGVELVAGIRPLDNLNWNFNITYSQNKIPDYTEYVDNWDYWSDPSTEPYQLVNNLGETDIAFSPSVTAASELKYALIENFSISLFTNYVGKQYIDNTSSDDRSLDPYLVNNLNFTYFTKPAFAKELNFTLELRNIFNEAYESYAWVYRYKFDNELYKLDGYFPQAGFHFLAGINLKF